MKVFGIGLSRTGTTSLTAALGALGFRTLHFPDDAFSERDLRDRPPPDKPMRMSALAHYDAMTDTPAALCYRQLDLGYPGSRFVLTLRDETSWLESVRRHYARVTHPSAYVLWLRSEVYGTEGFDADLLTRAHRAHVKGVLEYFHTRPNDLLCLRICSGQGYAELCPFLDRLVPPSDFPHLNALG